MIFLLYPCREGYSHTASPTSDPGGCGWSCLHCMDSLQAKNPVWIVKDRSHWHCVNFLVAIHAALLVSSSNLGDDINPSFETQTTTEAGKVNFIEEIS